MLIMILHFLHFPARLAQRRAFAVPIGALTGALFLPATLWAQAVDTDTRAGRAAIVENPDGSKDVVIGTTLVDLPDDAFYAFFEARLGDLLLVLHSPGGNACAGFYTWIHATPGDIRRSESFGSCAEATDISWDSETVRVSMPSLEPGRGPVTYVYDGKGPVRALYQGPQASGMAAGDWDFWIGRYPFEFVGAADLQAPLTALLGAGGLRELQRLMDLSSPMARDGDWIAGAGCPKATCGQEGAAVAVERQSGRLLVAMRSRGGAGRLWGQTSGALPGVIAEILR